MQHAKIINHIVKWLKDYALQNNLNGFILGISGGIDSALVSTLCAKTDLDVFCLDMPIHQNSFESNRAKIHTQWLKNNFKNVKSHSIDLTQSFDSLIDVFPVDSEQDVIQLGFANTRARLRMTTLYYIAGIKGLIVAGTGNKIEDFGIGFYTKYGDGGVDISPIADLTKTEVYALAAHIGIDEALLKAVPTDGLFEDSRTDEDQIGASYPELEWAMEQYDAGKSASDFEGREKEVFKIYSWRHKANQHKWNPIPVCKIPSEYK